MSALFIVKTHQLPELHDYTSVDIVVNGAQRTKNEIAKHGNVFVFGYFELY
jgi:hypothetical protein